MCLRGIGLIWATILARFFLELSKVKANAAHDLYFYLGIYYIENLFEISMTVINLSVSFARP